LCNDENSHVGRDEKLIRLYDLICAYVKSIAATLESGRYCIFLIE